LGALSNTFDPKQAEAVGKLKRMEKTPAYIAKHVRTVLKNGGSAPHAIEVQRFFRHEVQSRGWYTHELRKVARRFRRTIIAEYGSAFLLQVADQLFRGEIQEEKNFAVMLLQDSVGDFGKPEFKLFESWLDRVTTWADHDALVHYLIGPMIAADATLLSRPPHWARKRTRKPWHQRAAAVSLIHSTRQHKHFGDIQRITELLLTSDNDMVQKGLGWLLREAAKANPKQTVEYLMTIRHRAPRLVLRTACETLAPATRERVLAKN
jgi:3-methyladenine DNA glycosylase AlkD